MNEKFNDTSTNSAKQVKRNYLYLIILLLLIIGVIAYILKAIIFVQAQKSPFVKNHIRKNTVNNESCSEIQTIVLDPGHGGKDGGTKGQYSLEKENTLAIALKLGAIIKKHHPHMRVIYTRTSDIFVPLQHRVDVANENEADLFISIHCNSDGVHSAAHTHRARRKAYLSKYISYSTKTNGTETYILNSDRLLEENIIFTGSKYTLDLQVNSSILNNKDRYLMIGQDHHEEDYMEPVDIFRALTGLGASYPIMSEESEFERLKKSYQIAQLIEAEFANIGRKSRGVHESHFVVLKETIMPAVLIETGFMTNIQEEAYLNSEKGRRETAQSIYNAISKYMEFVKSSI